LRASLFWLPSSGQPFRTGRLNSLLSIGLAEVWPHTGYLLRLTFKYRVYPTKAQGEFLNSQLREAASLYNAAIEERIGAWKICRKSINFYDQANQLKAMRADGCLAIVNFSVSTNVLRRVDGAFSAFFARVRRGANPGFPRYRSSRRYDSITFPHPGNGYTLLGDKLRIQGAGHLKIILHRPIEGKVKTLTIKREAGRWFACFSVECEAAAPLPASAAEIGVDVGLNSFAVLSNGREINNPRYYRNAEARLRRCQRKVARRKKGSARRRKAALILKRAHVHVRNQRADFAHKLSRELVNNYGVIAIEDLNVKGLAAGMLAKSISDAGWAIFFRFLIYKAASAGRQVIQVDPRGTSQTCVCGAVVRKALADRWHDCPICGLSASRDHISARIILSRAWKPPSGANVEDVVSCVS
jgi:putative transposase